MPPANQPTSPASPSKQLAPTDVFPNLPAEVKSVPVVEWLSVGEPPAIRVEPGQYFPELEPLAKNLPETLKAGLDLYKAQNGDSVFFNPLFMSEQELQLADQEGKLEQLVPSYSELSGSTPQEVSPEKFDELLRTSEDVQSRLHSLTTPEDMEKEPAPAASAAVRPATTPEPVTTQRVKALQPGAPTSGPAPGAGRLLNAIIRKAV